MQRVVSVGGTLLSKNGSIYSEIVWPDTGGGCATEVAKPSWQHDPGCSERTTNDVAAVAWNVAEYDTYGNGGWILSAARAFATPIIAGAFALAGNATKQDGGKIFWTLTEKKLQEDLHVISSGTDDCPPRLRGSYLCTAGTESSEPIPAQPAGGRPTASARSEREATNKRRLGTMRLSLAAANRAAIVLLAGAARGMLQHNAGLTGPATWSVRRDPIGRASPSWRPNGAVQFAYVTNFGSKMFPLMRSTRPAAR